MSIYTTPPAWQPDAVPTPQGWKHPTRNELLVSIKLDMSVFEQKEEVNATVPELEATPVTEVEVLSPEPAKKSKKKNV